MMRAAVQSQRGGDASVLYYGITAPFGVHTVPVRCFAVPLRFRAVLGPFAGPCVVRCSCVVETVRDVWCAPLWRFQVL